MNTAAIRDAFARIEKKPPIQIKTGSAKLHAWLRSIGASKEILSHFEQCALNETIELNGGGFFGENEMIAENIRLPHVAKAGFLMIGRECGGDPITLHLNTAKLGYFSHEQLSVEVFDYQELPFSLEEFIGILESVPPIG